MKSVIFCTLLGLTIGTLVLAENGMALVIENKINSTTPSNSVESSKQIDNTQTPVASPETSGTTNATPTTVSTTSSTTTAVAPTETTSTTNSSTITPSTTTATTPTPTPTTMKPTTIKPTTTTIVSTSTTTLQTTAVPSPSPSSKDRQFDGLSFFGGIVLTTCLMAIAAFSWRFYKQCKDGSYRTL